MISGLIASKDGTTGLLSQIAVKRLEQKYG